jgi:hypothetical protein
VKRREFITLLGGATAWPLVARAQTERVRRIGVLQGLAESDPEAQARTTAFRRDYRRSDGPKAAIFGLTIDLPAAIPPVSRLTRRNW